MTTEPQSQTKAFEAEVKQLLDLVVNSLYSNKEIFLRELISNASDAADKLRFEALADAALFEDDSDLKIWVDFDSEHKTVTIRDNGIGMTRDEVIENLGTIANSGTKAFREMLAQRKAGQGDDHLIGQFGVGFYSAFVVADQVVVRTRKAGMQANQGVHWVSDGKGEYTIKNIDKAKRGTEVVLHLKSDMTEFLDDMRLRNIIHKYSDHIVLPIVMKKPMTEDDRKKVKEGEVVVREEETVNRANALWTLNKSDISNEDYAELYKHIAHDFEDPLAWSHNRVEGKSEYISLLYIPARAPFDLWNRDMQRGLKLYVKRVFVMDDAEHFMPTYLRFVKGIIDSNDLPLNVSREILQSNVAIDRIRAASVKRVLGLLEDLAKNEKEKYAKFWTEFGAVLKEGPAEDFANRDRIAKLLRFSSTQTDEEKQTVTLDAYVSRMPAEQKKIYYIIADSFVAAKNSPLLEVFRKKGIEVLLLSERVDEWLMGHLTEFEGKPLQSVAQGALDLGDLDDEETKEAQEKVEKEFKDVLAQIKTSLGDKVKEVRVTHRLTDSPACVVYDEQGMTGHMARLLKAAGQAAPETPPILEVNPEHPLVLKIKGVSDSDHLSRWSNVLLGQALLAEGEQLKDPAGFVKELNQLLMG